MNRVRIGNASDVALTLAARDWKGMGTGFNMMNAVAETVPNVTVIDERNGVIKRDGIVGALTTDGSSPRKQNRIMIQAVIEDEKES